MGSEMCIRDSLPPDAVVRPLLLISSALLLRLNVFVQLPLPIAFVPLLQRVAFARPPLPIAFVLLLLQDAVVQPLLLIASVPLLQQDALVRPLLLNALVPLPRPDALVRPLLPLTFVLLKEPPDAGTPPVVAARSVSAVLRSPDRFPVLLQLLVLPLQVPLLPVLPLPLSLIHI